MVIVRALVEVQLVQPLVVDSGMVGQFVEHGLANLVGQLARVGKVFFERQPKERDLVRQRGPVGAPGRRRNALVQAVEDLVVLRGFVVDHDGHVLEQPLNFRWQSVQRGLNEPLETRVVPPARTVAERCAPSRMAASLAATASKRHVPMLLSVVAEPDSLVVTADTGDRLHFLDWGSAPEDRSQLPPLLLIHGLAATAWIWAPIARRLSESTHVVALDLRGHGLSDSPRAGYELESLAYDCLTVMVANGWARDAHGPAAVVAGHGLGAMVAATMAGIQPDSIAALALIDGGWESMEESTGMTAAEFERSIGDPPEVLASMSAYLADRRDFDPPTWDADQERAGAGGGRREARGPRCAGRPTFRTARERRCDVHLRPRVGTRRLRRPAARRRRGERHGRRRDCARAPASA